MKNTLEAVPPGSPETATVRFEFVFCLYGNYVETENVYIDMIQFNRFSKARKDLEHLQKMHLNYTD